MQQAKRLILIWAAAVLIPSAAWAQASPLDLQTDGDLVAQFGHVGEDDHADFQVISNHLSAPTCQSAQAHAYDYAIRHFPRAEALKKPPYLIWAGPSSAVTQ